MFILQQKYLDILPKHSAPSNPSLHIQTPVESSQVPWFEHMPSTGIDGQSNSKIIKWNKVSMLFYSFQNRNSLLEQSVPCLPGLHEHCPVEVSQFPALLQSPGHVNSKTVKYILCMMI